MTEIQLIAGVATAIIVGLGWMALDLLRIRRRAAWKPETDRDIHDLSTPIRDMLAGTHNPNEGDILVTPKDPHARRDPRP